MSFRRPSLLACALAAVPGLALAQATVKPDGQFRYALGAGASYSSGNTEAASANLNAEGVRATQDSKWRFGAKALWARDDGRTTAENVLVGTQYDQDFTPVWFGYGSAEFLRDEFANIAARWSTHGGIGYHAVKSEALTWDVSAGLGYAHDRYVDPADVRGRLREQYGRAEVVFAEESSHKLTGTTSLRQKFSVFPALSSSGGFRTVFDAGLAVAMTPLLSLTVGLTHRYDSDPGVGLKKNDALFVTGIQLKID